MPPDVLAPLVLSLALTVSVAAVLILRGPLGKAWGRRIEGKAGEGPELAVRVSELEERVLQLEEERPRVEALEERLDFHERLLATEKEPSRELRP